MFDSFFALRQQQTSLKQEVAAGLTTFFTLAYITIVAPHLLASTGMHVQAAFVSTCLVAAIASILSGLIGRYPIALTPGLGLLSYFCFVVVDQLGYSWQAALGMVLISGVLFFLVTISGLRHFIVKAIPHSLGCCIASGIGVFIGLIALGSVGLVVGNHHTLLALGEVTKPSILLFFVGFFMIAILDHHKVPGAMIVGILATSLLGFLFKVSAFHGVFAMPHHATDNIFAVQFGPLLHKAAIPVIFTFFIVALFDSTGTLIGLTKQFPNTQREQNIQRTLLAESIAVIIASILGTSTVATAVENASGIRAGGRTGLTAIVTGLCFFLALFFAPVAVSIPSYATAAALFYIACLMLKPMADIDWHEPTEFIPAVIILLMIPLTYSISNGIGMGVICYVILNLAAGRYQRITLGLWGLALLFLLYFLF